MLSCLDAPKDNKLHNWAFSLNFYIDIGSQDGIGEVETLFRGSGETILGLDRP